jgi:hypothetical protein
MHQAFLTGTQQLKIMITTFYHDATEQKQKG